MVYLDLFSGTGGFALGLRQAGFAFEKHYFSEIDKYAIANYNYNFKESIYVGEIENISSKIERPDIVTYDWTKFGSIDGNLIEISDTQRYHLLGNEVTVPVVKAIAQKLMKYKNKNKRLAGISQEGKAAEIILSYKNTSKNIPQKFSSSSEVSEFAKTLFPKDTIELNEQVIVLFLDKANKLKGYYRHSQGGIDSTIVDKRIILSAALKSLSLGMILIHNHPSGNSKPSEADKALTSSMQKAAKLMDLVVLDHLIITKDSYYSFADNGNLEGLNTCNCKTINEQQVKALAILIQMKLTRGGY